ncbi:MAG: hypothetical protein AAF997_07415 [Myxococcota bacterium]
MNHTQRCNEAPAASVYRRQGNDDSVWSVRTYVFVASVVALMAPGCGDTPRSVDPIDPQPPMNPAEREVGTLGLSLEVQDASAIDEVSYEVSRGGEVVDSGVIAIEARRPSTPIQVTGLEVGTGYTLTFAATSEDGSVSCNGSTDFEVQSESVTDLYVYLRCTRPPSTGGLRPNGELNFCAQVEQVVVSPSTAEVGDEIVLSATARDVEGDPVEFRWSAIGGSIANRNAPSTVFRCTEPGSFLAAATVTDDPQCFDSWEITVTCVITPGDECTNDDDCIGVFPVPNCRRPTQCEVGHCVRGEPLLSGTSCLRGGSCDGRGRCLGMTCQSDSDCRINATPQECVEGRTCEVDPLTISSSLCRAGRPLPEGTPCSNGECNGFGECIGSGNPVKSQVVWVACKNSVAVDPSFLPSLLTVRPPATWKADPTETDIWGIGGEARFDKQFLDSAQAVIPGGTTVSILHDLRWTVQVRSGATMQDVVLRPAPIPHSCEFDRNVLCDPENDLPDASGNSGCLPIAPDNRCARFVQLPVSTDCAPGGLCEIQGATEQCARNGFCISDVLRLPLEEQQVEVTPTGSNQNITFTWYETSDRGSNPDGTLVLPTATFSEPTGPVGFRTEVSGINAALECMGGGTSGWSLEGPYPVFESALLQYFVPAAP